MVAVAPGWNIYTVAIADIDADMLRAFIDDQREQKLFAESLTLELKAERRNDRVVSTVAGFANNIGGILLLGVAETNPHFDTSPGVDVEEQVSVIEACRSSLEPTVIPEIVPVRIPHTEKVVLVVRVDQDPTLVPVTSKGKVWIRAPGQTVGATRDQIRTLCTPAPAIGLASEAAFTLHNLFRPEQIEGFTGGETCDFVIRAAGGLWLRPAAEYQFDFGTSERQALCEAFDASAFALGPTHVDSRSRFPSTRPRHEVTERTSRLIKAHTLYGLGGTEQHRMSLWVQKDGLRVAYAVTWEGRLHVNESPHHDEHGGAGAIAGDPSERRLSRDELATGVLTGIEAVTFHLPDVIARRTRGAPARQDAVYAWVVSREQRLSDVLDLGYVSRPIAGSVHGWGILAAQAPSDLDGAAKLTRDELRELFLDLGLDAEEHLASQDVERALSSRRIALSMHRDRR